MGAERIVRDNTVGSGSFGGQREQLMAIKVSESLSRILRISRVKIQISNNVHFTYDKSLSFEATKCEHFTFIVYNRH